MKRISKYLLGSALAMLAALPFYHHAAFAADKLETRTVDGLGASTSAVITRWKDMNDGTWSPVTLMSTLSDFGAAYKGVGNTGSIPASATDISTISGSATKTVYVTGCYVSGAQTLLSQVEFLLVKRSTLDTGGTPTSVVAVNMDSNDAAATAVVKTYAGVPTTGTPIGNVARRFIPLSALTGTTTGQLVALGERSKPVLLRGVNETLALNLNGVSLTGAQVAVEWSWFEL